jgi:(4S)-4-hydroxy-5-phosphonooxypentane-2,3-dione isomerase
MRNILSSPKPYIITVEFDVAADNIDQFIDLIIQNASRSKVDEPGCRRFDVLRPTGHSEEFTVFLYEIYDDFDAFNAHVASPHFQAFDSLTKTMVRQKTVKQYEMLTGN